MFNECINQFAYLTMIIIIIPDTCTLTGQFCTDKSSNHVNCRGNGNFRLKPLVPLCYRATPDPLPLAMYFGQCHYVRRTLSSVYFVLRQCSL
jgi:hypothetical protein